MEGFSDTFAPAFPNKHSATRTYLLELLDGGLLVLLALLGRPLHLLGRYAQVYQLILERYLVPHRAVCWFALDRSCGSLVLFSSFERVCYWIWFRTGDAKVTRKSSLLFASGGSDEAAVVLLLVDQVLLCSFVRPSLHVASSAKQEGAAARPCLFFSRSVPHSRLLPIASSVPLNIERTLTRETEVWVFS